MRALVLLLAALAFPVSAQVCGTVAANLSIEGTVTDAGSGVPVAGARVAVVSSRLAFTGPSGHFRFDGLAPGQYRVAAGRSGYIEAARNVSLCPGQSVTTIDISLSPQAVISGRVEDQDGWPVRGSRVAVARDGKRFPNQSPWTAVETDDRGVFRIGNLPPGRYYLCAGPGSAESWDDRYTDTYYPTTVSLNRAELLELAAGEERKGLVIRLQNSPGVQVQGQVVLPPGASFSGQNGQPYVRLRHVLLPDLEPILSSSIEDDGSFAFRNVQPGKYQIEPVLPPPFGSAAMPWAPVTEPNLEVGDSDVSGIVLNAESFEPADIEGQILFEEGVKPAPVVVYLTCGHAPRGQTASQPDGSFVLRSIPPGRCRVTTMSPEGLAIAGKIGDQVIDGSFEVKPRESRRLTITVGSIALASLRGIIVSSSGRPAADWFACFRSVKPSLWPVTVAPANSDGVFAMPMLPGEYYVWTSAEAPDTSDDDNSNHGGQLVTLVPGQNPQLRLVAPGLP